MKRPSIDIPEQYAPYDSPVGRILVARSEAGVTDLSIGSPVRTFLAGLHEKYGLVPVRKFSGLGGVFKELDRYFAGEPVDFRTPLMPRGTPFEQAVWKVLMTIPRGEVRSYAWVAGRAGSAGGARAAGGACGKNPLPILIPCHRVVRSDGSIGGYSCGISIKEKLLSIESAAS